MRLSAQQYSATAEALQAEAQLGSSPAEQERLMATARLASRLAKQIRERRNRRPMRDRAYDTDR